jgi:hypothetical protein
MDEGLIKTDLFSPYLVDKNFSERPDSSLCEVIEDYYKYERKEQDTDTDILRMNLLTFQKKKIILTKKIF